MNWTIVRTTLRERMTGTGRWFSLLVMFAFPLLWAGTAVGDTTGSTNAWMNALLIWLVGAGIIGEEVSSGTILLVLSRPVRRSEYIFSKWMALGLATAGVLVLQAVAIGLVAARRGHPIEGGALLQQGTEAVFRAFGAAAVVILYSTLIAGGKEVSAIIFTWAGANLLTVLGQWKEWPVAAAAGSEISAFILPVLDCSPLFGRGAVSWHGLVAYASTIVIALTLAIWRMNRRELSYAGS